VPLVSKEPVKLAVPARSLASASAPLRIINSTASKGRFGRSATISRRPLLSFVSLGWVKLTACGAAGGGAVSTPPMANKCRPSARQNSASNRWPRPFFTASPSPPVLLLLFLLEANTRSRPSFCRQYICSIHL